MNPNIILNVPPSTVDVLGENVRINTAHRVWIRLQQALDTPRITDSEAFTLLMALAYGNDYLKRLESQKQADAAVEAALLFFNFNEPCRPLTSTQKKNARIRSWDWNWDARYAIADFQRYYSLDLTDPNTSMHWWRFWALFTSLPADSASMGLIALRTASEDGLTSQQKRDQRERQRAHMLPARTEDELALNNEMRWGQDGRL